MDWTQIYGASLYGIGVIVGAIGMKDKWTWKHPIYGAVAWTLVIVSTPLFFVPLL